jgi:hypothetical protein
MRGTIGDQAVDGSSICGLPRKRHQSVIESANPWGLFARLERDPRELNRMALQFL